MHTIYGSYASIPIVPSWLKPDHATEVNVEIYFHIVSNITWWASNAEAPVVENVDRWDVLGAELIANSVRPLPETPAAS